MLIFHPILDWQGQWRGKEGERRDGNKFGDRKFGSGMDRRDNRNNDNKFGDRGDRGNDHDRRGNKKNYNDKKFNDNSDKKSRNTFASVRE